MFITCGAEEWRTWVVLVIIYPYAWYRAVVPSYPLFPVSREDGGTSQDIIDEDSRLEDGRDIPGDVVDNVLRFSWDLFPPLTRLRWFFMNLGGLECRLDDRLRGQFDQIFGEVFKQGERVGFRITFAFPIPGLGLRGG